MFDKLQVAMAEVSKLSEHEGYFYKLEDVLIVMVCGLLSSLENIKDIYMWSRASHVRSFFRNTFGIEKLPKMSHFYNMLSYVNYKKFNAEFEKWILEAFSNNLDGKTIAIDGKSICSTAKLSNNKKILHIASAVMARNGIILSSRECDHAKSSEVGALREIIQELNVKGALIVADALHCKPKSAEIVVENEAYYLFVVKDNNKKLRENIELHAYNKKTDTAKTLEKNGGRIETRTAYVSDNIETFCDKDKWKNLACVGAIHREIEKNDIKTSNWHYYISNKKLSAKELLDNARLEWSVESMHWLLDVHFSEDKTKVRHMEVQKNLNLLRKIVINLVKQYQTSLPKHIPMSNILKQNLFEIQELEKFITYFRDFGKLE